MSNPIQESLIPDLVPPTEVELKSKPTKINKPTRIEKVRGIAQGDCVELPTGERGIVMLVNPLGDCYVEVGGRPFVYRSDDLTRLPIAVVSGELLLHQLYLECHAYELAYKKAEADDSPDVTGLKKAWEIRHRLLQLTEAQSSQVAEQSAPQLELFEN